jgi:hypothetical protein
MAEYPGMFPDVEKKAKEKIQVAVNFLRSLFICGAMVRFMSHGVNLRIP